MGDDLVKRLREEIIVFGCPTIRRNPDGQEAADRIESQLKLIDASGKVHASMLARIEELEADIGALKAAFRVNMLRFNASHEEIDAVISAALGKKKDG
jgi:hypothetical protein